MQETKDCESTRQIYEEVNERKYYKIYQNRT